MCGEHWVVKKLSGFRALWNSAICWLAPTLASQGLRVQFSWPPRGP